MSDVYVEMRNGLQVGFVFMELLVYCVVKYEVTIPVY